MAFRISLNRLEINIDLERIKELISLFEIEILPVEFSHILLVAKLPFHHSDPFYRMLISQAMTEALILITRDKEFPAYSVEILS